MTENFSGHLLFLMVLNGLGVGIILEWIIRLTS